MRFLALLCCFLYSCVLQASSMTLHVDSSAKMFNIKLPANPTTGFRWVVDSIDEKHLKKLAEKYLPSSSKLIGSGGEMCFTFEKIKSSTSLSQTTIVLKYQRAWEEKPVDVKTVTVYFDIKKKD